MRFRDTKAWEYTRTMYWILVFGAAAYYYWLGYIKDFL